MHLLHLLLVGLFEIIAMHDPHELEEHHTMSAIKADGSSGAGHLPDTK
jgi:hypothetical protein